MVQSFASQCSFEQIIIASTKHNNYAFDRRTDGQTDGLTDGRTEISSQDRVCIPCSAVKINTYFSKSASAFGGLRPLDPLPGLRPWTPLGDFCPPHP